MDKRGNEAEGERAGMPFLPTLGGSASFGEFDFVNVQEGGRVLGSQVAGGVVGELTLQPTLLESAE